MNLRHLAYVSTILTSSLCAQSSYGASCIDSSADFPAVGYPYASWIRTPSVSEHIMLLNSIAGQNAVLFIGADPANRTNIDLTLIGANTCFLYVNPFAQLPAVVGAGGTIDVNLGPVPSGPSFVFQWVTVDPAAPRPLKITTTHGLSAGVPVRNSAFRVTDLDLKDPHTWVSVIFCVDVTGSAVNTPLQNAIQGDAEPNGELDLSFLLLFRPLDQAGAGGTLDFVVADCTAPMAGTVCTLPGTPAASIPYTNSAATCLAPIAGTLSSPVYSPAVTSTTAPCFSTAATSLTFNLAGINVPLQDVRVAGTYVGNPATGITNGLIRGFMSVATANAIIIPASTPVVGGQPLSALLPGGSGNCSSRNDRDTGPGGVLGWYLYMNFTATAVALAP